MAAPVEVLLHRGVPRQVEHAPRTAERIDAEAGEREAVLAERLVQDREVAASGGDALAEVLRWSRAELHLAARLQGQQARSGEHSRPLEAAQDLADLVERYGQHGVAQVADQPLELGADRCPVGRS